MGPLGRRLRALERRVGDRDFKAGAPNVDEDGLPVWDGTPGLSVESYTKAMGSAPADELTPEELEARDRLARLPKFSPAWNGTRKPRRRARP